MKKSDRNVTIVVLIIVGIIIIGSFTSVNWSRQQSSGLSRGDVVVIDIKGVIGSAEKIATQINEQRRNSNIKGMILRIDSPGGGSAAFQELYREVKRFRDAGKPVVAAIASVGASGGYYAALGASKIVANPASVTGSIGVIVDFPVAVELLEKIGLSMETVKSGAYKDVGSPYREFTAEDEAQLETVIQDIYNQFVNAVALERKIDKKKLLKIADGRIFTGSQALEYGLIDTLGTFEDAVMMIGKLTGIDGRPKLVFPQKKSKTLFDLLFTGIDELFSLFAPIPTLNYLWR